MKKNTLWVLLFATSCSSYYNQNGDERYLVSKNGPTVVVPQPLSSYNMSHFYDLPLQDQAARVETQPPS